MKQIFEGIFSLRAKMSDLLHYEASNSYNKTEYHFHGTVNFIGKPPRATKNKIDSLSPKVKEIGKF